MDPLSDVLLLLKPSTYRAGGFDLGGDFAIEFQGMKASKCYAVVSGQCWLSVEGVPEAVRLTAGDCFLLSRGLASLLASDLTLSAAITSIHDEPTHDWTVEELAQRTGMSRSTFALMFKQTVGVSPIDYLTRWRMLLAGKKMATGRMDPTATADSTRTGESSPRFAC